MKRVRKVLFTVICGIMLVSGDGICVKAAESNIMPCYEETKSANIYLTFTNNKANCDVFVNCYTSVSKITGTITLYDETDKSNVVTWIVNHAGYIYTTSKQASVKSGHKYTLSFLGTVYGDVTEKISASVTKSN